VFRIVKNSLTERAAEKAGVEQLKELLDGPTALTLVAGDPAVAAKALNDTARTLQILDFKGGLLGGDALTGDEIRSIARLPAREVLHGQLVGTIAAPLSGLVRTLNALLGGLASQLQQMVDQGLVSGEAEPEAAPESEASAEPDAAPAEAAAPAEPEAEVPAEPEAETPAEPQAESEQAESDEAPSDDTVSDGKEET